ncbi:MAG: endolytic transglycosylase MltG [Candidatus Magnetoovum sp. WYHC-5]|nr:endolytic transglycosylase MltG [Candidatus Magnetoovum sp. WYHC-5]
MIKKIFIIFFVVFFVISGYLLYLLFQFFHPVVFTSGEVEIYVSKGAAYKAVVRKLSKEAKGGDFTLLYLVGVYAGLGRKLKPGYYLFKSGITQREILRKFARHDTVKLKIDIIPGFTIWDIAKRFNVMVAEDEFLTLVRNRAFLDSLAISAPSIEGYLYPATYLFDKGTAIRDALREIVKTRRIRYPEGFFKDKLELIGMSENEVLTLASIIEREAVDAKERAIISSVYHNRLRVNMPLQADPTAIYGVKLYRYGVTATDLKNNTPYNTYIIKGLPPGPIASPSEASIEAALNPTKDTYLYFVAKGDGTHYFSETYSEHKRAIAQVKKK